jgi:hypothetical protein
MAHLIKNTKLKTCINLDFSFDTRCNKMRGMITQTLTQAQRIARDASVATDEPLCRSCRHVHKQIEPPGPSSMRYDHKTPPKIPQGKSYYQTKMYRGCRMNSKMCESNGRDYVVHCAHVYLEVNENTKLAMKMDHF